MLKTTASEKDRELEEVKRQHQTMLRNLRAELEQAQEEPKIVPDPTAQA